MKFQTNLFIESSLWGFWALFPKLSVGGFCLTKLGVGGFYVGVDIGVCEIVGVIMFTGLGVLVFYIVATIGLYGIVGI